MGKSETSAIHLLIQALSKAGLHVSYQVGRMRKLFLVKIEDNTEIAIEKGGSM